MTTGSNNSTALLEGVASKARAAGVFGSVELGPQGRSLVCAAAASAEPAFYRLEHDPQGRLWVSLVMADRWLSESIESDLMHTGDDLAELIEEELAELEEHPAGGVSFEHYRSDDKLFTFRTIVPIESEEKALKYLLAYEACFRNLGDMNSGEA